MTPKYPVYVISKGRADTCLTGQFLSGDGVPFHLVIEPQEQEPYATRFGADRVLVLPFSNLGQGSIPARNWVWEHSKAAGHERHWILDDNIRWTSRRYKALRIRCNAGIALALSEQFVDRYDNVAVAGLNYEMNLPDGAKFPPFYRNVHVYSCLLLLNSLPFRWRGRYNEDTDLCLQVLSAGWCTLLLNAFAIKKVATMKMKGGNTADLYKGDGRLRMARSLERLWPGVVTVKRRFHRPQHFIKAGWKGFDTKLKPKAGPSIVHPVAQMKLVQVRPTKSTALRAIVEASNE